MVLFLPDPPSAAYPVGATAFASPVQPAVTFGSATLANGTPALVLDEIAFTAYYPANTVSKPKKGVDWLLRPLKDNFKGFFIFAEAIPRWVLWPLVYFYGALLKVPVYRNAPLLRPKEKPWPLVIFSHGLGGSRTFYSQICSRMAATGKVVLAIEHRDGTSPYCVSREWSADGTRKPRTIHYTLEKNLIRPTPAEEGKLPLRVDQLDFRRHEVYAVYSTFVSMLQSRESIQLETIDGAQIDWSNWTADENQKLVESSKDVMLAGHSFGGCTMLHILSTPPPSWASHIPVTKTLIHDPWLDPIPSPGPTPLDHYKIPLENDSSQETLTADERVLPALLVINSEAFTLWDEHFDRLKTVVDAWGPKATLMTLVGSKHPHFSDFMLLPLIPGKKVGSKLMNMIARLSNAFLDGSLEGQLKEESVNEMEVETVGKKKNSYGKPKRRLKGHVGDLIVHS